MGHAAAAQASTTAVIDRFNDAFQRHDPSGLPALIAEHCVLENTAPAPDGERRVGHAACLELWQSIAAEPGGCFELEAVAVYGERAIIRWRYRWGEAPADSVRGVNLMRVEQGRIVEGLGYVKGPYAVSSG